MRIKPSRVFLLIIVSIALTWSCVWFFSNDKDIMTQVKDLESQIDSLTIANKALSFKNDSIVLLKQKEVIKYVKIKQLIKDKDNETDNAINNIYTLSEREIDSTIRHHTHKSTYRN